MFLSNKVIDVWNKSNYCHCEYPSKNYCNENHRLCAICNETINYGSHESEQPNSYQSWNIDHIKPLSWGGSNGIANLQAVHPWCNKVKANDY